MTKRTEVFIQFILDGDKDENEKYIQGIADTLFDSYGADPVSVKLEELDAGAN